MGCFRRHVTNLHLFGTADHFFEFFFFLGRQGFAFVGNQIVQGFVSVVTVCGIQFSDGFGRADGVRGTVPVARTAVFDKFFIFVTQTKVFPPVTERRKVVSADCAADTAAVDVVFVGGVLPVDSFLLQLVGKLQSQVSPVFDYLGVVFAVFAFRRVNHLVEFGLRQL